MADLTLEQLDALERRAQEALEIYCATVVNPDPPERQLGMDALQAIAMARKVPALEARISFLEGFRDATK